MESKCDVCDDARAKYKCPGCNVQTCSLPCVRRHKVESNCDGVRSKTDFVPVKAFTDINLLSDYRFLEDAGRKTDSAIRATEEYTPRDNSTRYKFKQQCKNREITLLSMPRSMSRRKQNRSYYHPKSKSMFWTVEWVFPQADAKYTRKVPENSILGDEIAQFIDPTKADPVVRQKLRVYEHPGIKNVSIFMKVEGRKADCVRYYQLDKEKTICENLSSKVIIEFPTIYCVICYCCEPYTILAEDEKTDIEVFTSLVSSESDRGTSRNNRKRNSNNRWHNRGRGGKQRRNQHDAVHDANNPTEMQGGVQRDGDQ